MFKKLAKLGSKIKNAFMNEAYDEHVNFSYSQYGEDLILSVLLPSKNGFYVDVGAHHPKRFSNTNLFYKRGWRGINVDPIPGIKEVFDKARVRDINLELGVGDQESELEYFIFNDQALNSFNREVATSLKDHPDYKLLRTKIIKTRRLESILDEHLPSGTEIDFLTVDAEGMDLKILQSNDWQRFRPKIVLGEVSDPKLEDHIKSDMHQFMADKNYQIVANGFNTAFYQDGSS